MAGTAASVVQDVLDDCMEVDHGSEGDSYQYIRYDTADRIVAALREAGMLRD